MDNKLYPCINPTCIGGHDYFTSEKCKDCAEGYITSEEADALLQKYPELNPDWVKSNCRFDIPKYLADSGIDESLDEEESL